MTRLRCWKTALGLFVKVIGRKLAAGAVVEAVVLVLAPEICALVAEQEQLDIEATALLSIVKQRILGESSFECLGADAPLLAL